MRNLLQDQLLKAGLVKKANVAQVAREQAKGRKGKAPPPASAEQLEAERLKMERAERDRLLAAEQNAQKLLHEHRAQARQIIESHKLAGNGEIAYSFNDGGAIKSLLVDEQQRAQLASGALLIVRQGGSYALLPRSAAEKVRSRDAGLIVLDHGAGSASATANEDDEFYQQFKVPDDLIW